MTPFFIFIEGIFFYGLSIYCILKKEEPGILYLPVLFFVDKIVDTPSPAWLFYAVIGVFILLLLVRNALFFRNNISAFFLIAYFLFLTTRSDNFELIRPFVFSVSCFFALIPLTASIYKKFTREVVFKELSNACFLILILFIANALFSTVYKFAPVRMYGITSGILFGNLYAAAFNTLPLALFVVFLKGVSERKVAYIITSIISVFFILLTLRRTVMVLSAFGVVVVLLTLLTREKAKMAFIAMSLIVATGYFIYKNTDFMQEFKQRVELRKLDQRDLSEEKRFVEYSILFDDMFVYHAYSPWLGFGLFNSAGNYGQGILGERSLHGDIPSLLHSSGVIGLTLYLFMVGTAFWQAIRKAKRFQNILIVIFCAASFLVYTITGRYTETAASILLFLILMLPVAKNE